MSQNANIPFVVAESLTTATQPTCPVIAVKVEIVYTGFFTNPPADTITLAPVISPVATT